MLPHYPDVVVQHLSEKCQACPQREICLTNGTLEPGEARYVIELVVSTEVVKHEVLKTCCCPLREGKQTGCFPSDVKGYIQYGDSIAVLATMLNTYGAISLERVHIILGSLLGMNVSPATILDMTRRCAQNAGQAMQEIQQLLIENLVNHYDETGIRVNGKLYWVHNASSTHLTYQTVHERRGRKGIDDNGVLANSSGIAMHDCWSSYWRYSNVQHASCNIHYLREVNGVQQMEPLHTWPYEMSQLLLQMKHQKEVDLKNGRSAATPYYLRKFNRKYDLILQQADKECPPPPKPTEKKRGRPKLGTERCLIERFRKYKEEITLFFHDYTVPFGNNTAERDVRYVKGKTKVCGCFRTKEGAQNFLNIMCGIITGIKNGITPFVAMIALYKGDAKLIIEKVLHNQECPSN